MNQTSISLSLPSKKWSIAIWASAAAISVVLSYLVMLAVAIVCVGLPVILISSGLTSALFTVILVSAFGLVMGLTIFWSLIPRRDKFEPPGVPIDLAAQPKLHSEIASIAAALREPFPADVYLTADANAFVAQRGGILGIGSRRVVGLGLPLLQTLNVSQFRAVLGHEFAHFYAGDTRLAPWVYNTRSTMVRVFQNLENASPFLDILKRFAIIAVAYHLVIQLLVGYWKLFMRLTQFISRRQEFRSDEIACHLAGSEALIEGLKTVNRSAVAIPPYWQRIVSPILQNGHQPNLAEGFAQFMLAPQIAAATATHLENQLKNPKTTPFDTHPPLRARIEKARNLVTPIFETDARPAVCLIENLSGLELDLIRKLAPALASVPLKPVSWDTVGGDVYIPLWRNQITPVLPLLAQWNMENLPDLLKNLAPIAAELKDPPGLLLTRDQRNDRAAGVVQAAFTLAMLDHGWTLQAKPGNVSLSNDDLSLDPFDLCLKLRSAQFKKDDWLSYCQKSGIGSWPLAVLSKAATA